MFPTMISVLYYTYRSSHRITGTGKGGFNTQATSGQARPHSVPSFDLYSRTSPHTRYAFHRMQMSRCRIDGAARSRQGSAQVDISLSTGSSLPMYRMCISNPACSACVWAGDYPCMTLGIHRSCCLAISPFPNLHSGSSPGS